MRTPLRLGLTLLLAAGGLACGDDDASFDPRGSVDAGSPQPPPMGSADAGAAPPAVPGEPPEPGPEPAPEAPAVNPFTTTAHDPFSTFAADVDTASWEIFHKTLTEEERLPDPARVRVEEFVNFFRYAYPPVPEAAADPFALDLELADVPTSSTVLLRVAVQGAERLADRPRANLVFLVDISGSMGAPDKLPVVQDLLTSALDYLRPDDTVAIVTYTETAQVELPPTAARSSGTIAAAIAPLAARGSTAGADGLGLAYDQAEAGFVEGGINHIVICTDGDFNVGPYTTEEILRIVEQRREGGVTFTALGFGLGNLNDEMMEATSNAGNGIYRVIGGPQAARRYAAHRMLPDLVQIAKDVKIQVEFNPSYVHAYRQLGYENRALADDDFRDDTVDAGEIGSGHQMTALYELALTSSDVPEPEGAPALMDGDPVEGPREVAANELVMVKLRYKAPGAGAEDPAVELRRGLDATRVVEPAPVGETGLAWALSTLAAHLRVDPFETEARLDAATAVVEALPDNSDADRLELRDRLWPLARSLLSGER